MGEGPFGRPVRDAVVSPSRGSTRVIPQDGNAIEGADVADRDPDKIKQDIDVARDKLATTVDALAERANPRKIADDAKAGVVQFVKKPAVAVSLAGLGTVVLVIVIRRITNR
jgi:hypothetical protein